MQEALPGVGGGAARRDGLSAGGCGDVRRERADQGAVRPLGRAGGSLDAGRRLGARAGGARRPSRRAHGALGRGSSRRARARCAGGRLRSRRPLRRASSSCSRRTAASCAARAHSRARSPRPRPGGAGSASTRSSSRPARRAPSPSSATRGRRSTPTAPSPHRTCAQRSPAPLSPNDRCLTPNVGPPRHGTKPFSRHLWNVRHTFRPVSDTGRGPSRPVVCAAGAGVSAGSARRACHQFTSAPSTITFAIT